MTKVKASRRNERQRAVIAVCPDAVERKALAERRNAAPGTLPTAAFVTIPGLQRPSAATARRRPA